MNIAIVDDLNSERERLKKDILDWSNENQYFFTITEFSSGEEFLASFNELKPEIVFMDIYMDGISGIKTAKEMREISLNTILVFLTSSIDYMSDAFSCRSFDYILKPIEKTRLYNILCDAIKVLPQNDKYINIISHKQTIPVLYSDIQNIVSDSNYILICINDTEHRCRMSFGEISEKLLSDNRFCVINRGVLINFDYVIKMEHNLCYMKNDKTFSINIRKRSSLEQELIEYRFNKKWKIYNGGKYDKHPKFFTICF